MDRGSVQYAHQSRPRVGVRLIDPPKVGRGHPSSIQRHVNELILNNYSNKWAGMFQVFRPFGVLCESIYVGFTILLGA
jgi:hypothetical protein